MDSPLLRRSFIAFHLVLGLGLLAASLQTILHALAAENRHTHQHIALIAAIEAIGAILFVIPRTLRPGALLLVLTIGLAFVLHTLQGEWRPDLAIYAVGAWYVLVHGSGWQARRPVPTASPQAG
jgi:uncharacterized membrane protein YphA (DoxX/SURF4 family)